jgi:hypothetical protein
MVLDVSMAWQAWIILNHQIDYQPSPIANSEHQDG